MHVFAGTPDFSRIGVVRSEMRFVPAEFLDVGGIESQTVRLRTLVSELALMKTVPMKFGPKSRIDKQFGLRIVQCQMIGS